jgi:SAM-dependent methyltransferase
MDDYSKLKAGVKWMWSLGDYTEVAPRLEPVARDLAALCGIRSGMDVLDVAAGSGNFAIAAARLGAHVTASDITPKMVELGTARSAAEGLQIDWFEADAEELPFESGRFDVVASVFGAMFAPQPERVATELFRVARPGGTVAMANYSDSGFLPRMVDVLKPYSSAPPRDLPSPFEWGDEVALHRRFDRLAESIEVQPRKLAMTFDSAEQATDFWERTNGPVRALRTMLPAPAYAELKAGLLGLARDLGQIEGGQWLLESDYVLVVARKRSAT